MTETTKTVNALKAHLALNVKNVDASIEFYKKMLGIEPLKVRAGYAKFDVQNPPLNFTLNQVPAARCRIWEFRLLRPKTFWRCARTGTRTDF